MARYFRTYNESPDGEIGYFYFEEIDHLLTRIVNEFGNQLYWSTPVGCKNEAYDFTDQPEFNDEDIPDLIADFQLIELSSVEFEEIWRRSFL